MSSDEQALRDRAVNLLARREHSRQELTRKLSGRGYPSESIESVVDLLAAEGLLSDERFTESFIQNRIDRGYGPVRIRRELKERGVDGELIEQAFDTLEIDWRERAEQARRKKFGGEAPEDYRERARQSRFLYQRGFSNEQISKLFRQID